MRVRELMSPSPISVTPSTPIMEARYLMRHKRFRHLPVVDGGRLVGIITDRDIRLVLPSPARRLSFGEIKYFLTELTVGEVMTTPVIASHPERDAGKAGQTMLEHKIGALPVVEGDQLVGILTETDLIAAFVDQTLQGAHQSESGREGAR